VDGTWLYRTPPATENDTPLAIVPRGRRAPEFSIVAVGRSRFRAVVAAASGGDDRGTYTIQVLEPLDPVDNAVSWIVQAHRGSIAVTSRVSAGSEFRVSLPHVAVDEAGKTL
jgi:hypothetical protein